MALGDDCQLPFNSGGSHRVAGNGGHRDRRSVAIFRRWDLRVRDGQHMGNFHIVVFFLAPLQFRLLVLNCFKAEYFRQTTDGQCCRNLDLGASHRGFRLCMNPLPVCNCRGAASVVAGAPGHERVTVSAEGHLVAGVQLVAKLALSSKLLPGILACNLLLREGRIYC